MDRGPAGAVELRAEQRRQWDRAASGWRRWSPLIERASSGVSERLVALAGVTPGSRVLDVGAGYGEPSLTAARRAGPAGRVLATDISPGMLAVARERCADAGLHNVDFAVAEAASLRFPPARFDAAVSRWGIIFEPDAQAVAASIRTFLEPGGRLAISSWGPPERVPYITVPMRTALRLLGGPPPAPGAPGPLSRPTPDSLAALLTAAGFTRVAVEAIDVCYEWPSVADFIAFLRDIAPPLTALIDPQPPDRQHEVWAAIAEAIAREAGDVAPLRLANRCLLAAGRA